MSSGVPEGYIHLAPPDTDKIAIAKAKGEHN